MNESRTTEAWLLRHHITLVVEWAVQMLGIAVLVSAVAAFVAAFIAAAAGGSGGTIAGVASFGAVLGFGFTLWFSSGPFPIKLSDGDDQA